MSNKHKNPTISFRVSDAERKQIEARILASGLMKKDYFVRSCINNRICVVGKKETIYPLLKITQELYQRLVAMQQEIISIISENMYRSENNIIERPTKHEITELQEDFINILNATVIFETANDIGYLYRLVEKLPFTYAKLALQENGLQNYFDAMTSLNTFVF